MSPPNPRLTRARLSLEGLSVGDALGEQFFSSWIRDTCLTRRRVPNGPWRWTDDTAMALSIVQILQQHEHIDQNQLAQNFAARYQQDPDRGYGQAQHDLLPAIHRGVDWRTAAQDVFRGQGSFGNGGAMRAGPLGAYFADDWDRAVTEAAASAEVTHAHPDGQAGAIAVAIAAAWAWTWQEHGRQLPREQLLQAAFERTPRGRVRQGLELALTIPLDDEEFDAANLLGDGSHITAADTVPFCLWIAAKHLDNYPEALWTALRVHGDIDTNCAIIGSITAMATGLNGIPTKWRQHREPLENISYDNLA